MRASTPGSSRSTQRAHPQDTQPERLERRLLAAVSESDIGIEMNRAVDLDDELSREADEVDDERANDVLPAEVVAQPIAPERGPQDGFAGSGLPAHEAGASETA
ncbi:MAG TPA: hypothetical protein VLM85_14345 [Polyangiaceae bacterium]|nr:hypothetical protein [Polyangiaceae bacterium]